MSTSEDTPPGRLILHHYGFSNFAEKARLMLGCKGLAWDSVEIPSTQPKPAYTPLTGGYRCTPSLQIDAEVYCDTRRIAEVLEQRHPTPSLYPGDAARARALCDAISPWSEAQLLWPLALYITGINEDRFPDSFHRDRAILHGKRPPSRAQVRRAAERNLAQLRPQLAWIEDLLPAGAPFLLGKEPGLIDFVVYHPLFLLEAIGGPSALLEPHARLRAWTRRVAAIGSGSPTPLSPEEALDRALRCEPATQETPIREAELRAGDAVTIVPRDDQSSPSQGTLLVLDEGEICIRHRNDRVGAVAVHFPRIGYDVRPSSRT